AAGKGERLRPLTDTIPKCLVPIQNVPLLGIWLELCRQHGIDEVLVNTHSHSDVVHSYLREHCDRIKVRITEEEMLLGSAGTLLATPAIFDVIPHRIPADIGFDVLPKLLGKMAAYPISEYLVDVGTPASYQSAQLTWPGWRVPVSA